MAVADLEAFIRERLGIFDPALDAAAGSALDQQVVQPILRRLGTDPFTVDFAQFAQDRLAQEFPDLATREGDAVTDLLLKPALLLFDPLIREAVRIKNAQSFKDPTILTTDEADALGANLFAQRSTGDFARGQVRIYYAAPQSSSVSPANFVSSKSGLHFFPTSVQSIRADEMLFNIEGSLYYFDINVQAEAAGDEYNIGPDELVSMANLAAAVRVTNKRRFRFGVPAETAVEFVGRAQQELSEKSLVTERGVRAKVTAAFSEVTQVAVVGFNDPEMQRDVVVGGGLGPLRASGFLLHPAADGENAVSTRRVVVDGAEPVDFLQLIGGVGPAQGFTLTVHGGFTDVPQVRDVEVKAVVNATTLDLADQVIAYDLLAELPWALRKNELTLSGIPGGILFPNTGAGTISMPEGVHVGGALDVFIRATDFDTSSLVLEAVVDDAPILTGNLLETSVPTFPAGHVGLTDLVLGTTYAVGDGTYKALELAALKGFSLQVLDGPAAGSYRVISVTHAAASPANLLVDPAPPAPLGTFRWRLLDVLDVDLVEPKETKIAGNDLLTQQASDVIQTAGGVDLQEFGVGQGDILRILSGPDAGDFVIQQVLTPLYQTAQLDRKLTATATSIKYAIFRSNTEGGLNLPLVRVTALELLDASGQSTGTSIPYAKPVDIRSLSFANVAHGIKQDLTDGRLGMVGDKFPAGINCDTLVLKIWTKESVNAAPVIQDITFAGANPISVTSVVDQINTQFGQRIAVVVDGDRVGIVPLTYLVWALPGGGDTATVAVFGADSQYSTADIKSPTISLLSQKWDSVTPIIDPNYDVVEVLDGFQVGFYASLTVPYVDNSAVVSAGAGLLPEVDRHIRVGARSLGAARLFFLAPTSIEFDALTVFATTLPDGQVLRFLVDLTLEYQVLPALPNDVVPKDGAITVGPGTLVSSSADFYRGGILAGDILEVTYQPVAGTVALADPVPGLAFTTIILSLGGGVDKTLIFVNDDPNIGAANVTRSGVAAQINRVVGQKVCSINAGNFLEFEADISIIVRKTGTANTALGFSTTLDTNNDSDVKGRYTVASLTATELTLVEAFAGVGPFSNQHFKLFRPGLQRTVSTQMSTQLETAGLYYADVELISEGTGDRYNIAADLSLTAEGYASDGYWLTTADPNLTFSSVEKPVLHISRSVLEVGVSDSPANATQISGQNLQISYERSSLTSSVQSFASSEEERVLCASPLARHLIPYFVRFDLSYVGGSKEDVVIPDIKKFIQELSPEEYLEVSDLEGLVRNRGATSMRNPVDLIAVVHPFDRQVTVERSQDRISPGKLAAFVPDVLNITRRLA